MIYESPLRPATTAFTSSPMVGRGSSSSSLIMDSYYPSPPPSQYNMGNLYQERANFDFDLNLLDCEVPSLDVSEPLPSLSLDCQVPSPSSNLEFSHVLSPTMFSPGSNKGSSKTPRGNPYQRDRRLSSNDSQADHPSSLSDAFNEFHHLRASLNVKVEPLIHHDKEDTPLLRQCLSQSRAFSEDVKIEPMISMAVEQVKKDIENTCKILGIRNDPYLWSKDDVSRWMHWTMQQYGIIGDNPYICNGPEFVNLTENDFLAQFPEGGDLIYAQMDIWRSSAEYCRSDMDQLLPPPEPFNTPLSIESGFSPPSFTAKNGCANIKSEPEFDISTVLQMLEQHSSNDDTKSNIHLPPMMDSEGGHSPSSSDWVSSPSAHSPESCCASPPPPYSMAISQLNRSNFTEDEETDDTDDDDSPKNITVKTTTTTTNIHLWQFVKELLLQPELYSGCIHWMDREKGIFKIVDSVKVATLWGKRKNRPAMNYDKLSRSLRQYYKKGIMKKTERSQRLVYQFCNPYHL